MLSVICQVAKTDAKDAQAPKKAALEKHTKEQTYPQPQPPTEPDPVPNVTQNESLPSATGPSSEPSAPSQGPAAPSAPTTDAAPSGTPPASPYTTERSLLRDLTMPTHPNFNIPSSPSPPPPNSEEAATLSTTTKKFDRFLELKRQGVHFNSRLENSASLRNPSLLPKLMEFAGISEEEAHASTLEVGQGGVPTKWPEEWYVENLMRENERRERKAKKGRGEVEFVKESARSGASSQASTPKAGSEHRKTKFERR